MFKMLDEESERAKKSFADERARHQHSFDEDRERSERRAAENRVHFSQLAERARRQMFHILQQNVDEQEIAQFTRRRNGFADAG